MQPKDRSGFLTAAMVLVVALAFGARVWQLGAQSLWLDEALSVVFARPDLRQMLSILVYQDLHPPLYYFALHVWMRSAGDGEFAVRFLSVIGGLPAVPATYVLGSAVFGEADRWRGRAIGFLAATFLAVAPFMVYYAQEARMYSQLATFGVLSSFALWKLLQTGRRAWWLAFVGFTAALLYTQYFGGLVVAFEGLYLLGRLVRDPAGARRGVTGLATAGALYLPWLPAAYLQIDRLIRIPDFWKGDFQLSFLVEHVFAAFTLGQFSALAGLRAVAIAAALLLIAALGVLGWRALRVGGGELYVLLYLLVPFVAFYAVVVRDPKFTERYLIMLAPAFYLVLALGLVSLARVARRLRRPPLSAAGVALSGVIGATILVGSLTQLWQVYYGPGYRKDDNRAAVSYVEQHFQPGDVVILMMNTYQSWTYYSRGTVPWAPLQPGPDREAGADGLNRILAGHQRVWLYLWNPAWADPTEYVRQSVDRAFRRLPVDRQFSGLELRLYQIDPSYHFTVRTDPQYPKPVDYGNQLQLLGYDLDRPTYAAGENGKITLYWKGLKQLDQDYIVSIRLTDGTFYWWRQDDRPAAFTFPTNYWLPGQVVSGQRDFVVPPGTPPGTYQLEVGVYGQGVGSDLSVMRDGKFPAGTAAAVATIQVTQPASPPDPLKLPIPRRSDAVFDDSLRFLGSSNLVAHVSPGGPVALTLWWQALGSRLADDHVRLYLRAGSGDRLVTDEAPAGGRYLMTSWTASEVVEDQHRFVVPADEPPGEAHLMLEIAPPTGGAPGPAGRKLVDLGTIQITSHPRLTAPPAGIQNPTSWHVGSFAQLIGYSLSATTARSGEHLALTLYWKALGPSGDVTYTAFSHLLDRQELIWAQDDHPPGGGDDPTSGWTNGEYVVDHYDLAIKANAAPGPYQIEVGMYDPATGKRLPILDDAGNQKGDRIVLASVQIQ